MITIVITEFYKKLDDEGRETVLSKLEYGAAKLAGRVASQIFATQIIADRIVSVSRASYLYRNIYASASSFLISSVMIQGLIEEAALASQHMYNHSSTTYWKVQPYGLDMIYFLVEDQLKPYLDFIHSQPNMCKRINNELCKLAE